VNAAANLAEAIRRAAQSAKKVFQQTTLPVTSKPSHPVLARDGDGNATGEDFIVL
jgi:hypothetical protein